MKIHYSDDLEQRVGELLKKVGIKAIHESINKESALDFYLPDYEIYIEIKKYHSDRVINQLKSRDNIILVQGRKSVEFLEIILCGIKQKS